MPEFLDTSQPIVYLDDNGEYKATSYFEDLLFGYLQQMGGESEDLIDQSVNIINTLPSTLEVKISALQKDVNELSQRIELIKVIPKSNLESRIENLEQLLNSFTFPKSEDLEPRIEALEQTSVIPIDAKFSKLQKEVE